MSFHGTSSDHLVTISASGEIDHAAVPRLTQAINEWLAVPGITTLLIDLDDVTFLSAGALGALVAARNRSRLRGVQMRVRCTDPRLRRLFAITSLESMLLVEPPPGVDEKGST
jgi:anti-sigma B factor antagonist